MRTNLNIISVVCFCAYLKSLNNILNEINIYKENFCNKILLVSVFKINTCQANRMKNCVKLYVEIKPKTFFTIKLLNIDNLTLL